MSEILAVAIFLVYFVVRTEQQFVDPNIIPLHLLECYRSPVQLLPMSLRTLIDLIRKIESQPYYEADLRMEVDAILSRFWRDGIKRDPNVAKVPNVLPYSGDGKEFYKYNILRRLLPLSGGTAFPSEALTLSERCTLHRMLSSGMEIWERGDEFRVCPYAEYQHQETSVQLTGAKKSGCPIELGVVESDFGTLSPNHVLLGIASSLQRLTIEANRVVPANYPARKKIDEDRLIDNFWATTIAGDIAEILVFQLPYSNQTKFGPHGFWNDTLLPARFYLKTDYNGVLFDIWEDTGAELLGGLDGVMIGSQLSSFDSWQRGLRLSQVLEMFYLNRGEEYPNQLKVCGRKEYFEGVLLRNRAMLQQQVVNFADVLAVTSDNFVVNSSVISMNKFKAFNSYAEYMRDILSKFNPLCSNSNDYIEPRLRLNVLFDGTWDQYTTLQILMKVSTELDVSYYGSSISIINGLTGNRIISHVKSTGDVYLSWMLANDSMKDTRSTDLTKGFLGLKTMIESDEFQRERYEPAADVTLVLGKTALLTDSAYERITSTVKAIKSEVPDMRFVYVIKTPDSRPWVRLTSLRYSQNDKIITIDDDNLEVLYNSLEVLETVPSSISPRPCTETNTNRFTVDQYVTPGISRHYIIHPAYFCSSPYVDIEIENDDYGHIMLCLSRTSIEQSNDPQCTGIGKFEKRRFRVNEPCSSKVPSGPNEDWDENCRPIYIRIMALKSTRSCKEKACRFVDQIKYKLNVWGIGCSTGYGLTCSGSSNFAQFTLLCVASTIIYLLF